MGTEKYPKRGISIVEDKRHYISTMESISYGYPDNNSTRVEAGEEEDEAQIMALSPKQSDEMKGNITEARLAWVMVGREDSVMEEETYEVW